MAQVTNKNVIEMPIDVDAGAGLFGIMTKPTQTIRNTGFIFINSGLLHRVGPFRLYVEIARQLAERGFPSIRLDQSGKGDSDARPGVRLVEATIADVSAAAECLKRETDATQIVLGGLCSGADDALQVASDIAGLRGLFMFDGYAPTTLHYYFKHYGPKLFSAKAWLNRVCSMTDKATKAQKDIGNLRNWSTRPEMIRRYRALVDQGIKILAVYTSGAWRSYNYALQLTKSIDHSNAPALVTECYFPHATHLFPVTEHRREAITAFIDWAERSFSHRPAA